MCTDGARHTQIVHCIPTDGTKKSKTVFEIRFELQLECAVCVCVCHVIPAIKRINYLIKEIIIID